MSELRRQRGEAAANNRPGGIRQGISKSGCESLLNQNWSHPERERGIWEHPVIGHAVLVPRSGCNKCFRRPALKFLEMHCLVIANRQWQCEVLPRSLAALGMTPPRASESYDS